MHSLIHKIFTVIKMSATLNSSSLESVSHLGDLSEASVNR